MLIKIKMSFVLIILFAIIANAQTSFGFHAEPFFSIANVENHDGYTSLTTQRHSFTGNVNLTFSFTFRTNDDFSLSVRPGVILGSLYGGIDGAFFGVYNLSKNKYLLAGLNDHINVGMEGAHNSASSESVNIPFAVVGAGIQMSKRSSIELQFHYSLNNVYYGRANYNDWYKVPWLFKLSFGIEWEL